jgi:hypothetical protein
MSQPLTENAEFERSIAAYLHQRYLFRKGIVGKDELTGCLYHASIAHGYGRVSAELARVDYGRDQTTYCGVWAAEELEAHEVHDIETGRVIGTLQATDWELVKNTAGIQEWSKR